ncbi:MAG: hypothetical protein DWQ37_21490 [Planctomycetota bacterium]|nr:MAG: hypothetical protein DWQ37_21490 [Planctomycetota bacterium]
MDSALIEHASSQFLGRWKRLVSTTNWEKGQIIHQWRQSLIDAEAPVAEYSDDAWSRRVGNVTPQHVGRLRRVFERFGSAREDYPGLYWSHFQAGLDWDDAEMWLEGAVQNDWSISEMRHKRWETHGALAEEEPSQDEAVAGGPWDDDAEPPEASGEVTTGTIGVVQAPEGAAEAEEPEASDDQSDAPEPEMPSPAREEQEVVRPFAALPPLPADVNDAFEAYKLCILRHKMAGWHEISRDDMVASLRALEQLALQPADV